MTKDEILRIAKEVDLFEVIDDAYLERGDWHCYVERFSNLVAAAEREACAKVIDEMAAKDKLSNYYKVAANAIRARGQE